MSNVCNIKNIPVAKTALGQRKKEENEKKLTDPMILSLATCNEQDL
jgi:hypothetical protein